MIIQWCNSNNPMVSWYTSEGLGYQRQDTNARINLRCFFRLTWFDVYLSVIMTILYKIFKIYSLFVQTVLLWGFNIISHQFFTFCVKEQQTFTRPSSQTFAFMIFDLHKRTTSLFVILLFKMISDFYHYNVLN